MTKDIFAAFSIKKLQTTLNVLVVLEEYGKDVDYLRSYVRKHRDSITEEVNVPTSMITNKFPPCPMCGSPLSGRRLCDKTTPWKSHLYCTGGWQAEDPIKWCGYEKYYRQSLRGLMIK